MLLMGLGNMHQSACMDSKIAQKVGEDIWIQACANVPKIDAMEDALIEITTKVFPEK